MKAKLMLLVLITLCVATISSAGFTIQDGVSASPICNTETDITTLTITNALADRDTYTVTLSGSASSWSTAAPSGFSLESSESKTINIYSTPFSSTLAGDYDLKITISAKNGGSDSVTKTISVSDCHAVTLTAVETQKEICSGETTKFEFSLKNEGKFTDTFLLSMDGSALNWATLNQKQVSIEAGQSTPITVFIAPDFNKVGDYDLTLTAKPASSDRTLATSSVSLKINGCYDHSLTLRAPSQNICDGAETRVPVTIINTGKSTSEITLTSKGASWASVDQPTFLLPNGAEGTANLLLNPPLSAEGDFTIEVISSDSKGKVSKTAEFPLKVNDCRAASINIKDSEVRLCAGKSSTQEVTVINDGELTQTYAFTIDGPSWAGLTKASASLNKGESTTLELKLSPQNTNPGKYNVKVSAGESSDSISVEVLPDGECYGLSMNLPETKISVSPDKPVKMDIDVENIGAEAATYSFSVSGTGANLVKMNPGSLTLKAGAKDTVFLYVSASSEISSGNYDITLTAKQDGGKTLISKNLKITVGETSKITGAATNISISGVIEKFKNINLGRLTSYVKLYWIYILLAIGIIVALILFWKAGAFKNFKEWLNRAEGEPKLVWNDSPKKKAEKPVKKDSKRSIWSKFNNWLEEDVPEKKEKFKETNKLEFGVEELEEPEDRRVKKVSDYIDLCRKKGFKDGAIRAQLVKSGWEKSTIDAAFGKKKSGLWKRLDNWMDEEESEEKEYKKRETELKKKADKAWKKKDGLWKKFTNWLEEEEAPVKEVKPKKEIKIKKEKPKKTGKKKGLWSKFNDWLDEE